MVDEREPDAVVDLLGGTGAGPLWGTASRDLNATLLRGRPVMSWWQTRTPGSMFS